MMFRLFQQLINFFKLKFCHTKVEGPWEWYPCVIKDKRSKIGVPCDHKIPPRLMERLRERQWKENCCRWEYFYQRGRDFGHSEEVPYSYQTHFNFPMLREFKQIRHWWIVFVIPTVHFFHSIYIHHFRTDRSKTINKVEDNYLFSFKPYTLFFLPSNSQTKCSSTHLHLFLSSFGTPWLVSLEKVRFIQQLLSPSKVEARPD